MPKHVSIWDDYHALAAGRLALLDLTWRRLGSADTVKARVGLAVLGGIIKASAFTEATLFAVLDDLTDGQARIQTDEPDACDGCAACQTQRERAN